MCIRDRRHPDHGLHRLQGREHGCQGLRRPGPVSYTHLTVCLLQFDYAVPSADPALRGVLPDMQTVHCILGILLLVGAVSYTHLDVYKRQVGNIAQWGKP